MEIAPDSTPGTLADNPRDSTVYNLAGQPTDVFTRRGFHLTLQYDALGRLTRRVTPAATTNIQPPYGFTGLNPQSVWFRCPFTCYRMSWI